MGRRGANQIKLLNLSVPADSIGFWADRLSANGTAYETVQRFGTERLHLRTRAASSTPSSGRGLAGPARAVGRQRRSGGACDPRRPRNHDLRARSRRDGRVHRARLDGTLISTEGAAQEYEVGDLTGHGRRSTSSTSRTYRSAPGSSARARFTTWPGTSSTRPAAADQGLARRARLHRLLRDEGPGYFKSVYNRSPSGALRVRLVGPEGFQLDEDFESLGDEFQATAVCRPEGRDHRHARADRHGDSREVTAWCAPSAGVHHSRQLTEVDRNRAGLHRRSRWRWSCAT